MSNLSREDLIEKYGSIRAASRELGIPESTLRMRFVRGDPAAPEAEVPPGAFVPPPDFFPPPHIEGRTAERCQPVPPPHGVKRYILTSAQNNAPLHRQFWQNLQALARQIDAEVLVSYTLYDRAGYRGVLRRPESRSSSVWWAEETREVACNERVALTADLRFCGELDLMATTSNPTAGFDPYCGESSLVLPHNRLALRCVPGRKGRHVKQILTTGSVTQARFIQRKAGQLAEFHHVLGAVLVEVSSTGAWYAHHINASEDGSFYWLDHFVKDGQCSSNYGIEALVAGDVHIGEEVGGQEATLGGILQSYHVKKLVLHDLVSFSPRSHHRRSDVYHNIRGAGRLPVREEFARAGSRLREWAERVSDKVVVVHSNHHDHLLRWIEEADWRQDPTNAAFYLHCASTLLYLDDPRDLFPRILSEFLYNRAKRVRFLRPDESLEVKGIEVGIHGHAGVNGSRGTPRQFSKLGFRTFTGHTHSPSIVDGCYTVGTMGQLSPSWTSGPSSWAHAHGVVYPNGKRALLFVKDGKWRPS